jgi:hypothetical protein
MAGAAATGYGIDTNWYADSGASNHITGELEKMTVRDKYGGQDQVHTASGAGMDISNIGHSVLQPQIKIYILEISCMCPVQVKVCYLFTVLPRIIMLSLNFIQISFL